MTPEEMKDKIAKIKEEAEIAERDVRRIYAISNNPYKVGDVISDHYHTIKIEDIKYNLFPWGDLPCCTYYGTELKADGTPKKRQGNASIYQPNIKKEA